MSPLPSLRETSLVIAFVEINISATSPADRLLSEVVLEIARFNLQTVDCPGWSLALRSS
jgi:hypothetical protein